MTGSEKYTWGVVLTVGGSIAFVGGVALSATLIGACLGVPLAIIGLPALIWGMVWAYQGRFQKQQEVISAGIREGIASAQAANLNVLLPPLPSAPGATSGASAGAAPTAPIQPVQIPGESISPQVVEAQGDQPSVDYFDGKAGDSTPTDGSTLPS